MGAETPEPQQEEQQQNENQEQQENVEQADAELSAREEREVNALFTTIIDLSVEQAKEHPDRAKRMGAEAIVKKMTDIVINSTREAGVNLTAKQETAIRDLVTDLISRKTASRSGRERIEANADTENDLMSDILKATTIFKNEQLPANERINAMMSALPPNVGTQIEGTIFKPTDGKLLAQYGSQKYIVNENNINKVTANMIDLS